MSRDEPSWWYRGKPGWQARLLAPAGALYGAIACRRMRRAPRKTSILPVICIGNFTAGGTGKTPFSIALSDIVREIGHEPVFLSRGYGGSLAGPLLIDPHANTAADVGDEPLLLARAAPTVIARDRAEGADLIERTFGTDAMILMDDGLQNPSLRKDVAIAVLDINRTVGNGLCIPAGPLRAPLSCQMQRVDAVLLSGAAASEAEAHARARLSGLFRGPLLRGEVLPAAGDVKWLRGASVVAYAGIANPDRFFALLRSLGAVILEQRTYRDHHAFTDAEASSLLGVAQNQNARLITTEKDFVRLYGASGPRGALRDQSLTLPVAMSLQEADAARLRDLIIAKLDARGPAPRV